MAKEKKKKSVFKRILLGLLIVVLVFFAIDFLLSDPSYVPPEDREYTAVTVDQLYEELSDNALKAKDTYTNAYVAVTGKMRVIDSDGESITIYPLEYETLDGIHCTLNSDEQRDAVKEHSIEDTVIVKGKITEVDDIWPYTVYVDSIE